jgi:hypothetical protein
MDGLQGVHPSRTEYGFIAFEVNSEHFDCRLELMPPMATDSAHHSHADESRVVAKY